MHYTITQDIEKHSASAEEDAVFDYLDEAKFRTIGRTRGPLQRGDRIVSINGNAIDGLDDFKSALSGKHAGEVVEMVVERKGAELTLAVPLQSDH